MKRALDLKRNLPSFILAATLITLASFAPLADANNDAIVNTKGNVAYVSGGVGAESIDRLTSIARDFNLKLVFALKSGDYVSGVNVAIVDTTGKTLLNATSDGPWFLTRLPAGNYQIVATFAGTAVTRSIAVSVAGLNTVDMRWASE